jgi:site-specific recombinase XerD
VPLLKPSIEILENKKEKSDGLVFEYISNAFLNLQLKKLAKKAKIFKNITFHIARNSFATTITLNNDVPLITVSKMLGHSNVKTTQIYAKVLQKKVSSDMEILNKKLFE